MINTGSNTNVENVDGREESEQPLINRRNNGRFQVPKNKLEERNAPLEKCDTSMVLFGESL